MAKTGRKRGGGQYDDYLPQTACTSDMFNQARELADEKYRGSIGALIREALQEKLDRMKQDAEPPAFRQIEYRHKD